MRGFVLAVIGMCLALGSPAAAAGRLGEFFVPPPVAVEHAPSGVVTRSVKLVRVIFQLPEGEPWASRRWGVFNESLSPLVWKSGKNDMDRSPYEKILTEEFVQAGFSAQGVASNLFETDDSGDLQLGVFVDDMKGRFCEFCSVLTRRGQVRGAVLMHAQWQVYSPLERRVVAKFETTGGYETEISQSGNELRIAMQAFRENIRLLLNEPGFRALVASSDGLAVKAQSAAPTILLQGGKAATGHALPQAVAATPAIFSSSGMGTGFLVSTEGHLLTNQHVVGDAKYVKVRWSDGAETLGEVLRTDRVRDVALVKTDPKGRPPIVLAAGLPAVGDPVTAIGTPLDPSLQGTVTRGVVSGLRKVDGQTLIQSDVVVNHGNSGGPLLNDKGMVVGVTDWGVQLGEAPAGLNFFIPIQDALTALNLKLAP